MKKILSILFTVVIGLSLTSCDDPELNALMDDYCSCISESRKDEGKLVECVEKMEAIKERYKDDPYKLSKVLSKTDECY